MNYGPARCTQHRTHRDKTRLYFCTREGTSCKKRSQWAQHIQTKSGPCSQELYQIRSSIVTASRPLMQLDLDLAQRYDVLGQEQNGSTKRVSPLVKSTVNSLDNSSRSSKMQVRLHPGRGCLRWPEPPTWLRPPTIFVKTKFVENKRWHTHTHKTP